MASYNEEFRLRVVKYLEAGHTHIEAHRKFNVGLTAINRWSQKYQKTGEVKNSTTRPHRYRKIDIVRLEEYKKKHPNASSVEIGKALGFSHMTVLRALRHENIEHGTRKKYDHDEVKRYIINNQNMSQKKISEVFGCSVATIRRIDDSITLDNWLGGDVRY